MNFAKGFTHVELHTHLDGSFLPRTILAVSNRRNIELNLKTENDVRNYLQLKDTSSLREFLQPFLKIVPVFQGDRDAIFQMSLDFVQQCAEAKTCYAEARFSPHILSSSTFSASEVISTVLEAFGIANKQYGVETRVILAGLREMVDETHDLVDLAKLYQTNGVVGIDVAGDEQKSIEDGGTHSKLLCTFREAARAGVHRTVHAGENGPASSVREAVHDMEAERIGHGYNCVPKMGQPGEALYQELLGKRNIHFEVCPSSSVLTGSVPRDPSLHPIQRLSADGANYSINTDDTMITGRLLHQELEHCQRHYNISHKEILRTTLCAARSSFLSQDEKQELLHHLAGAGVRD